MRQAEGAWPLEAEVGGQADAAFRFITDKEVEAPERFQVGGGDQAGTRRLCMPLHALAQQGGGLAADAGRP